MVAGAVDGDQTLARAEREHDLRDVAAEGDHALRARRRAGDETDQERQHADQRRYPRRHDGCPPLVAGPAAAIRTFLVL
ncbi:MAG: hypothetical protein ACLFU0_10730 [Alphaproteobacteria bacterium]